VSLDARVAALAEAVELATGRLPPDAVAPAAAVVRNAGTRLGLGLESTVVALGGPTGAGKSSLFNALVGEDAAGVGRRRPTTAAAAAAVWGEANPALLDWLDVRRRHRAGADAALDGLVLLDLPDFDSVEATHRAEVDRLLELVDLVVWVVDPQKYADAAWHDRYLRRLRHHGGSTAVVLNQVDVLAPGAAAEAAADLRRLLAGHALEQVPVLAASAATGEGVDGLRGLLAARVEAREAATVRLEEDLGEAVAALSSACGSPGRPDLQAGRERLVAALSETAGVPIVVRAVEQSHRRRGALATGWPLVRWLRRLRPDPMRRLRLPEEPQELSRTSLPGPTPVATARVESAARALADDATAGLPDPWPGRVREVALAAVDDVDDALDRAVAGAELPLRRPRWWRAADAAQRAAAAIALAGLAWLLVLVGLGFLRLDDVVPLPDVEGVPVPTALLLGGIALGLLLALVARIANRASARRRARSAERILRRRVADVAEARVLEPIGRELDVHEAFCRALRAAGEKQPLRLRDRTPAVR
jgi:GTP-binding protein EngB required for normal cell division